MEICHVTRMLLFFFYFTVSLSPPVFSTVQFSHRPHAHLGNASDQKALLGFISAITYDPSQALLSTWKPNVSFCHWTAVICSRRRQRVVSLNVSSMGLQGTISPLLANLSFLRILDLHNNSFHGHIPHHLGSLFRLKMLRLKMNQLQGSIPPTLSGCRTLRTLIMSNNNLTGNIPAELCVLPKLHDFSLYSNNLTGTIPACLGNISSLEYIYLSENHLYGSVPSELGMLSHVTIIYLASNHLTGQIPSSLSNCTNLLELSIAYNQLTGHIPAELCSKNTQLWELLLGSNQLSGSIPASLFNCTKFEVFDLPYNDLSGVVPMEFGKLTQLQVLNLGDNPLAVTTILPILTALTNCSNLKKLYLFGNKFKGHLPFSIGHLSTKITYINLEANELTGEIPPPIGNLTSLVQLILDGNFLTGAIPSSLNMLQQLQVLYMGGNNLHGNIPMEIGQLKSLGLLGLSENNLYGRIPDSIAGLQQLRYLLLNQNQLSGNIPANLGKCVNLLELDLSHNRLTGRIPREVGGLANLALYFNLSNNLLDGPMPSELSKMTMLQAIDISANRLTGYIPSLLKNCRDLEYLNLSRNAIEGMIPLALGELQNLKDVDFSSNNLSGRIPMSLENLKMLSHVNFSFNKLSGEVPKGGVFKKLGAMAFMGNPGLCGPWISLPPCSWISLPPGSAYKHKSVAHLKKIILFVVAVATTVLSCLCVRRLWGQNHKKSEARASLNVGYQRISYEELMIATGEFSNANLLGEGSFGKMYKGVLNNGTMVAVKLLNLENEGAHKSFDRECKVLGRVRHRNLIRIITSYSNLQIKALIFPFMPNGSLENWLYPNREKEVGLSLIQRLNIAIDIAQGMTYLHHHCFVQVIHCDLKPSNILLGEDKSAYLIDFGIATICFANYEDSNFTSTHALKGSRGYIPPEYGFGGYVTTKGDVYSYGIVLLEMLTGKKPTHNMFVEGLNLQKWVGSSFPNKVEEVVDKILLTKISVSTKEEKDLECLSEFRNVGLLCTKESPKGRPTMIDILSILQNIRATFLGAASIPKFQSNITHLLGSTSTSHDNTSEGQSSCTF